MKIKNTFKPAFAVAIIMSLCLCFFCYGAAAAETDETKYSGDCGANGASVTWTLDKDGTLTIGGTGQMQDYSKTNRARLICLTAE